MAVVEINGLNEPTELTVVDDNYRPVVDDTAYTVEYKGDFHSH